MGTTIAIAPPINRTVDRLIQTPQKTVPHQPSNQPTVYPSVVSDSPTATDDDTHANLDELSGWPRDILEAYQRAQGPYTIENVDIILQEEAVELYNGWLVRQEMTNIYERRVVANLHDMLSIPARMADFGQALPDQVECLLHDGSTVKPDMSLVSWKRMKEHIYLVGNKKRPVMDGGPELVIEVRSPSNRRAQERRKRQLYFSNRVQIIWDVDEVNKEIWVYHAELPSTPTNFTEEDIIDCEPFVPGWRRRVADIFAEELSATAAIGEVAEVIFNDGHTKGVIDGHAKGVIDGQTQGAESTLRVVLPVLAKLRFGADMPNDLAARLELCSLKQLQALQQAIEEDKTLVAWLELLRIQEA